MKESKYISAARAWGKENGYGIVEYVTSEEDGEIFYLFDTSLAGKKTGISRFLKIHNDGAIERSLWWTTDKIARLYRLYSLRLTPGNRE